MLSLVACFSTAGIARAQELPLAEPFAPAGVEEYDAAIPSPEDVLGYRVGERHTRPDEIAGYFEAVAAVSDRVRFEVHGSTVEGRPLVHAIVTSAANQARLEEIREANDRLYADPEGVSESRLESMPAVVYLAYSVHGNEASGSDASILALYHLAAGRGAAVEPVLDSLVVIIDPMLNPDGRSRFVNWVNSNRGAVPVTDPQDREHNEPWPGGRTNHYWFDLNRDWLPLTQPESRARRQLFGTWHPQLLLDFHEMGRESTFFFQPGVASRTNPNTPQVNQDLTARVGTFHARAFDRIGQPYFSEESFDDFFYGKGSTYPDLNGAVGILFEQASSRSRAVETRTGVLEYPRSVRNQFVATLSSLEAAVALRTELLLNQRDFYAGVGEWADGLGYEGWLIDREAAGDRSEELVVLLERHGIRVHELTEPLEVDGRRYEPGATWVAPLRQSQGRLLKAMMERVTEFRDSVFYDVSAWTLPLAYDVNAAQVKRIPGGALGREFRSLDRTEPQAPVPGSTDVGWFLPWGSTSAARALVRWIEAGYEARLITRKFTADTGDAQRDFPAGTVLLAPRRGGSLVPRAEQGALLADLGIEREAGLISASSAHTSAGPDLGGPGTRLIERPEAAILVGSGVSSSRAGEVWHLLSATTGLPVTLLDVDRVQRADLDRYGVILLAGGSLGERATEPVSDWVLSGGTLIVTGSAVSWAVDSELMELEPRTLNADSVLAGTEWADLSTARSALAIPGTIFGTRLDPTHPLSFGIGDSVPLFVSGDRFYDPATEPGRSVGVYSESPRLSGWLSAVREPEVAGAAAVSVESRGRGRVIGIHAYPAFRGYWLGGARLVWNAVLFGPAL